LCWLRCYTSALVKGAVVFPTAIMCRNNMYRSYRGDVDYFGVYCPGTAQVYLVPIADVPDRAANLRVASLLRAMARCRASGGRRTVSSGRLRAVRLRQQRVLSQWQVMTVLQMASG
jgi:hypothetical protein